MAQGKGSAVTDLDELRVLANRGFAERKQYLDALEETYGDQLRAGNAKARRLLIELSKSHAGAPGTPLAKEFFERLLPLLPKADHEMFSKTSRRRPDRPLSGDRLHAKGRPHLSATPFMQ